MAAELSTGGRAITMREVAQRAGVSIKTVSRVVNSESGVTPELTARVQTALDDLGYRPNIAAGNLRRGRTSSIAVVLQDIANDYSATALQAIDQVAVNAGVAVLTASLDEEAPREQALVDQLIARRVDGLILMPATFDQSYLRVDLERGLSAVIIDREPQGLRIDSVTGANFAGSAAAARHLVDHGHTRIAALVDQLDIYSAERRLAGFRAGLAERGVAEDPRLIRDGVRGEIAAQAVAAGLLAGPRPPTAFYTGRNVLTVGVVRALQAIGREREVAVLGFDDVPHADLMLPRVSVVNQNPDLIGATAARFLLERIGGATGPARSTVVPFSLIARGSGEIPPAP